VGDCFVARECAGDIGVDEEQLVIPGFVGGSDGAFVAFLLSRVANGKGVGGECYRQGQYIVYDPFVVSFFAGAIDGEGHCGGGADHGRDGCFDMEIGGIYNEKELLLQVSQGDREAFRVLYTAFYPHVQRYIGLFEPSGGVLDELAQDVFVRIWDKRVRLAEVETFKGYLFLVTRNVVFNFIRALKVRRKVRELDEAAGVEAESMEKELLFKQYYRMVLGAMAKLPPGRRKILKMSIDEGLSLDEIAVRLGITRSGVKKQLYAATAFVRQYLQEHGEITLALLIFLSLIEG
jgi:RNA polymerase sigma factor (sigma-70 family)